MTEVAVQPSFSSGEWSPNLYSRVDIQKYHTAAALLQNWFVDYRNGASTRPGTSYVIQAYNSAYPVRVITFQASFNVGYAVEIGNGYMRFHYHGAPVLEATFAVSGATQANPCVLTIVGNNYAVGDWIYVSGVAGMTQLNKRFFQVLAVAGNNVTIGYITNGANIDSTTYGAYTSGGTAARVYTLPSPYIASDNFELIKFAQSTTSMVICHPNHGVYVLTLISANNWTLVPAVFGATLAAPAAPTITTTLAASNWYYSYGVTAIDANGQESPMSPAGSIASKADIRAASAGTNTITWTAVPGAVAYNVYEAYLNNSAAIPAGAQYGFIGTTQGVSFTDSNIGQNFSLTPPIARNPFTGYSVASVTITTPGSYIAGNVAPTVSFTGSSSAPAIGQVSMQLLASGITNAGSNFNVNDYIYLSNNVTLLVTGIKAGGAVTAYTVVNAGSSPGGVATPTTMPMVLTSGTGSGFILTASTWSVALVSITSGGSGYAVAPTVVFSSGTAAGTAVLASNPINPTAPGFVQQRLVLAAPTSAPATFWMSQTGQYYNYNVTMPVQASNSVSGTLVSGTLNSIKSIVGASAGMLVFTDKAVWLVNGGSAGAAITASAIVANPQSYIGASDVPPIVANFDVLFVQSKGSAIRSLSYNVYYNIFTGDDISVLAAHLFYGYTINEWCWAEQPFYSVQAVRSDGQILALTYMKDQGYLGWSHYITNGLYKSICAVTEQLSSGVAVDAVYTVTQRTLPGIGNLQYIERFVERSFPNDYVSAWCVDAGIQYSGSPATTFTGAEFLAGMTVTGLADGVVIPSFVMPANGIFTLGAAASTVTIGLGYNCDLQTLPLDTESISQGKVKKIQGVDLRVVNTLGMSIGSSFSNLVPIKDLVIGNVSTALTGQPSQVVTGLMTADAYVVLDPTYTVPGQFCIRQSSPYPATISGVFPRYATMAKTDER